MKLVAGLLCSLFFFGKPSESIIDTVSELDVSKYTGRWYQVYASPFDFTFQGYGKCITADYGIISEGNISVLNSQLNKEEELEQISGYAYYRNVNEPGKLTVYLDGVPVDGPYWVVQLGEIINNEYSYSIVTVPSQISLWVLARNVYEFYKYYNVEVTDYLEKKNYSYIPIHQTGCVYTPTNL
jgi:apolipoprotein D and lipocalin family protein